MERHTASALLKSLYGNHIHDFEPEDLGVNTADAKSLYVGRSPDAVDWTIVKRILYGIDDYSYKEATFLLPLILLRSVEAGSDSSALEALGFLSIHFYGRSEVVEASHYLSSFVDAEDQEPLLEVTSNLIARFASEDRSADALIALSCIKYALANIY